MTEKQFFRELEKTLAGHLEESGSARLKMMRRLFGLLQQRAADLRDMDQQERNAELKRIFIKTGFNRYWNLLQRSFDRLLDSQNRLWRENTSKPEPLARSNARLISFEKVNFTRYGNLGEDAVQELQRQFERAYKENWTRQQLVDAIRPINEKTGAFAESIADTALRGWDRTVTATKAELAGVEEATFDGPALLETSHEFCVEHYQMTFTREEILDMVNGQLEPVITYGGGYRCRHRWRWNVKKILN